MLWKISKRGGGLARSAKKLTEKTRLFYGKWGGDLTQSIKSLTEKVKENPYFQHVVKLIFKCSKKQTKRGIAHLKSVFHETKKKFNAFPAKI